MQTSYEVVKNAIHFTGPDRLPMNYELFGHNDFHGIGRNYIESKVKPDVKLGTRESCDDWGCIWSKSEVENMGLITGHPLSDWSNLDKYQWPDADDPRIYKGIEKQFEGSDDKFVMTGIFMLLFERLHGLRGFENTMMDLYLDQERLGELADRIVDYDVRIIENMASRFPGMIHSLSFSDDWGTETAAFISPKLWDEFFKPRYKNIFDICKKHGWIIWMHSCGKINELIPSLIDIGLDVIEMMQPTVNGIEEIGRKFAGKIAFASSCDIQKTLPFKSTKDIEEEAIQLMKCWGTEKGGFILLDYGDGKAIGVKDDKKKIMFDAFIKNDRWRS